MNSITKKYFRFLQVLTVSIILITSASALVIIPNGSAVTDPLSQGYPTCTPGNCVIATTSVSTTTTIVSTSTNITSYSTTTISGPVTNITSTTTNINSSTTNITGTTTVQNFVIGTLTGFLKAVSGVVSATSSISLVSDILGILGISFGGTGTSTAPTYGQILVGNAGGTYDYVSTTTLTVAQSASSTFASSTAIGATVQNATATGIFFLDNTGKLAQDTANFNYDNITKKLTITGGVDPLYLQLKDVTTATGSGAYLEVFAGNNAATSSTGNGRIRYNASTTQFEASVNGGAYAAIGAGAGTTLASGTATNTILYWNGTNWVENTGVRIDLLGNATMTNATLTSLFAQSASITNATTTNLFASIFNSLTAFISSLGFNSATGTNIQLANATTSNLVATGTFSFATGTIASTTITTANIANLNISGVSTTNATVTNATVTNLFASNSSITNSTTTNLFAVFANFLSAYFENLGFNSATGTNLLVTNATGTNLSATGTLIVAGTTTLATTSATLLNVTNSFTLASSTPATTSMALYQQGGTLYWNGTAVGGSIFTASTTGGVVNGLAYLTSTTSSLVVGSTATSTNAKLEIYASSTSIGLAVSNFGTGLAAQFSGAIAMLFGNDYATSSIYANDVDFGNTSVVRVNATTTDFIGITGIANGTNGKTLTLVNASSTGTFILYNQNASSTATNRVITGTGANMTMAPDVSVNLIYDATSAKWRVVGGGGSASTVSATTIQNISGSATTTIITSWYRTILVDASTGNQTIVLPTAIGNAGAFMEIKRIDSSANFVTIDGFGSQTIDGGATQNIYGNGVSTLIRSDGANLYQVADYNNGVTASFMRVTNISASSTLGAGLAVMYPTVDAQYGNDITQNAAGTEFTLKAGKTYKLEGGMGATVCSVNANSGTQCAIEIRWKNVTTGLFIGTAQGDASPNNITIQGYSGTNAPASAIITPTVDTVVQFEIVNNTNVSTIGNWTPAGNGGRPYAFIQVIAGNSPVTGQSVDYAQLNVAAQVFTGAADITHTSTAGNISTNGTLITLKAGKTYTLRSNLAMTTWGGASTNFPRVTYQWKDSSGTALGTQGTAVAINLNAVPSNMNAGSYIQDATYTVTPAVDTQVKLAVNTVTLNTATNVTLSGDVFIQQLGSTATTEYENNILSNFTASGTIMTGTLSQYTNFIQIAQASSSITLSLPNPSNTNLSRLVYVDNTGTANFDMHGIAVLAGESAAFKWNGTTWKAFGNKYEVGAEYGEVTTITDGQTTSSLSYVDVTNGSFVLPSAGTWEVEYAVANYNSAGSSDNFFILTDSSDASVASSEYRERDAVAQNVKLTTSNPIRIITTGSATYKLRYRVGAGTVTLQNVATSNTSRISWKKIGGFAPIVGQTVDGYAANWNANFVSPGAFAITTSPQVVNYTSGSSITSVGGVYTLQAGKTYKLTAYLSSATIASNITQFWWASPSALATRLGKSGAVASPQATNENTTNNPAIHYITTSVATSFVLVTQSGLTVAGIDTLSGVQIEQIGTSATTGFSFSAMTNQLVNNVLDNTAFTNIWNWSASTSTTALAMRAMNMTTGTLLSLVSTTSSSTALALNVDGSSAFAFSGTNFATSTVYAHNVDFGNTSRIRVLATTSAFLGITGIAGGVNGREVTLVNASSTTSFTLYNHTSTTTSLSQNRIITGTGLDLTVAADTSINLVYDATASTTGRWRVVGGSGSAGGSNFLTSTGVSATDTLATMFRIGGVSIGTTSKLFAASSSVLYVAGEIWNTLSTTSLRQVGQISIAQSPYAVAIKGKMAYVTVSGANNQIASVDITNPANMTFQSVYNLPAGAQPRWASVNGNYLYTLNYGHNSLNVFDISIPGTLNFIASTTFTEANPNSMVINGKYGYIANRGTGNMTIVNLSNPALPVQTGVVAAGATQSTFTIDGRYLYSANFGGNISVFDLRDPANPRIVGNFGLGSATISSPWGIVKSGNFVYVTNNGASDIAIFKNTGGTNFTGVGNFTVGSSPMGITLEGHYLHVVNNGSNSVNIIDIASTTAPVLVASTSLPNATSPTYVVSQGKYNFVPSNGAGSFFMTALSVGGVDTNALTAGTLEAGDTYISGMLNVNGVASARDLQVGLGGIISLGSFALLGTATSTNGLATTTIGASLYIASSTPATTTNNLYQQGGTLYWNGQTIGVSQYGSSNLVTASPYGINVDLGSAITSARILATTTAFLGITGFATGTNGTVISITNASSTGTFVLYNESATSSLGARILTGLGANITIPADATVQLKYDSSSARWRVLGNWAPSGTATVVTNVTATTTLSTWGRTIIVDGTNGPFTITLPTAVGNSGGLIEFKRTDSTTNIITIDGYASSTIDGSFNIALPNNNQSITLRSDGTNAQQLGGNGAGMFAEYGENNTINPGAIASNGVYSDLGGSGFSLPSAGTWRVEYTIFGAPTTAANTDAYFQITDSSDVVVANSIGHTKVDNSQANFPVVTNTSFITTTASTSYKLKLQTTAAAFSIFNGILGNSKITWTKISGQSAVTGQSVDLVYARKATNQTFTTAANQPVLLDTVISGNIPLSAGTFTLSAGKTYRLVGNIGGSAAAAGRVAFQWRDTTNNVFVGNPGYKLPTSDSSTAASIEDEATAIFTPTTNVTLQLWVTSNNLSASFGSGVDNATDFIQAQIYQLGSSATTEYENNIISNLATGGYVATGTLSQYTNFFQVNQTTTGQTLLLPTPANQNLARLVYVDNTGSANFTMYNTEVASGESGFFKWNGTQWKSMTAPQAVAAEYADTGTSITDGQTISTTLADITGSSFTLPTAGTWKVTYNIYTSNVSSAQMSVMVADTANVVVPNSRAAVTSLANTGSVYTSNEVYITTAGATTYKLRANADVGSFVIRNNNNISNGGNSKVTYQKVSGYIPVSGQSVDFLYAKDNNNYSAVGDISGFTAVSSNNMSINSGIVRLTAGKTYRLTANVQIAATTAVSSGTTDNSGNIQVRWFNNTTGVIISNTLQHMAYGTSDATILLCEFTGAGVCLNDGGNRVTVPTRIQPTAEYVFTPTVDTDIKLRVTSVTGDWQVANTSMTIQQLGSTNVSTGWSLSSVASALMANVIDNTNFAQIWNWSTATSTNALTMSAPSLTTGNLLVLNSSSTSGNALLVNGLAKFNGTTTFATSTMNQLLIGTSTPLAASTLLQLSSNSNSSLGIFDRFFNGASSASNFFFRVARGTATNTLATQDGDNLMVLGASGYASTTGFSGARRVALGSEAVGNWTSSSQGTRMFIEVTASGTTATTRMLTIEGTGAFGLGTTTLASGFNFQSLATTSPMFTIASSTGRNVLTLDNTGFLGLGTTSPSNMLTVSSTTFTGNDFTAKGALVNLVRGGTGYTLTWGTGTTTGGLFARAGQEVSIGSISNHSLGFYTGNSASKMTLQTSGALSIGTTSSPGFLTVMGTSTSNIAVFQASGGTGCAISATGVISCSSDATFKHNISTSTYGLDTILSLNPQTFNWNTDLDGATKTIGFIAQEVQYTLPELVSTDSNGKLALNQTGMIPILVKAMKELNNKIFSSATVTALSIEEITASSTLSVDAKLKALGTNAKEINDLLAELASTTSATSTISTSTDVNGVVTATTTQTFVGKVLERVKVWLADASNGIVEVFVGKINSNSINTKELCVGDGLNGRQRTCLTQDQIDNLLNNTGNSGNQTSNTDNSGNPNPPNASSTEPMIPMCTATQTLNTTTNICDENPPSDSEIIN